MLERKVAMVLLGTVDLQDLLEPQVCKHYNIITFNVTDYFL